jgi:hypothetical protein
MDVGSAENAGAIFSPSFYGHKKRQPSGCRFFSIIEKKWF